MADNPLQRVQPGDPFAFPAETFNVFCETAETVARLRRQFMAGVPQARNLDLGLAWVRNDSGADLARFSVVGLGDPVIGPTANLGQFQARASFAADTPATATHTGKFAILLEPVPAGKIGRAAVAGLCQVQIYVGDAGHTAADVKDADATQLESGTTGAAQILWKESGTGASKWAIVRLGPPVPESAAKWAKVQAGHVNFNAGTGAPVRLASVKLLDGDGDELPDAFDVYLPWAAGKHPAVFPGDAVVIMDPVAGVPSAGRNEPVVVSPCDDDARNTVKAFAGATDDIPTGWSLCDGTNGTVDLTGRFIMGINPDGQADENTIGDTGGYRKHGETENNHSTHGQHVLTYSQQYVTTSPQNALTMPTDLTVAHATEAHTDTDNRPRYYVLAYMQRRD